MAASPEWTRRFIDDPDGIGSKYTQIRRDSIYGPFSALHPIPRDMRWYDDDIQLYRSHRFSFSVRMYLYLGILSSLSVHIHSEEKRKHGQTRWLSQDIIIKHHQRRGFKLTKYPRSDTVSESLLGLALQSWYALLQRVCICTSWKQWAQTMRKEQQTDWLLFSVTNYLSFWTSHPRTFST